MSCSRPVDEGDVAPSPAPPRASTCVRCSLPPEIIVRTTAYCWEHFDAHLAFGWKQGLAGARQRSRIGPPPSKGVTTTEKRGAKRSKVMLAFSGGSSSRTLLDLIIRYNSPFGTSAAGSSDSRYRAPPIFESLEILYVDESEVDGFGPNRTAEISALLEPLNIPFRTVVLSSLFPSSSSTTLSSFLSPTKHSPTSLNALHASLLHSLLRQEASQAGCEILLTGETATRVAIKTIAGMAEGRGFSLGEEVGVRFDSFKEAEEEEGEGQALMVSRPLSGVLGKEVAFYCARRGLEYLTMERPSTGIEPKKAGIEALTEEFVNGLEANFPSTVSTIIRTAQKLGLRSADAQERGVPVTSCPLCRLPAQEGAQDWRKAITISSLSSYRPATSSASPSSSAPTSPPLTTSARVDADADSHLEALLCYSCLLITQGTKPPPRHVPSPKVDGDQWPPYVLASAAARRRRELQDQVIERREVKGQEGMRGKVEGYLLDE